MGSWLLGMLWVRWGPAWAQPAHLVCWAPRSSLFKSSKVALSTLVAAGSIDRHHKP